MFLSFIYHSPNIEIFNKDKTKTKAKTKMLSNDTGKSLDVKAFQTEILEQFNGDSAFDLKFSKKMILSLRIFYELLMQISVALFVLATFFTIKSGVNNLTFDDLVTFLIPPISKILAFIIILLFVCCKKLELMGSQEDSVFSAESKKTIDCFKDWINLAAFILTSIFISPFIAAQKDNSELSISYWLFIACIGIKLLKLILKWVYFGCGAGQNDFTPWSNSNIKVEAVTASTEAVSLAKVNKTNLSNPTQKPVSLLSRIPQKNA